MPVPGSRFGSLLTSRFRSDGGFDFRRRQQNLYRLSWRKKCVSMKKLRVFYMVRRLIWEKDGKVNVCVESIRVPLDEPPSDFSFFDLFDGSLRLNYYRFFEDESDAEHVCRLLSELSPIHHLRVFQHRQCYYLDVIFELEGSDGSSES